MVDQFLRPGTLSEAVELKHMYGEKSLYFAGGTEINSTGRTGRKIHAISIESLGLDRIEKIKQELYIGSAATIQQLIDSKPVPAIIKTASYFMVNRNIRNMATAGGNIGANKSCSTLIPVLTALKALLRISSSGGESYTDIYEYINKSRDDLITNIIIPDQKHRITGVRRFSRTANDISILSTAVSFEKDRGAIKNPCIAIGGVSRHVVRLFKLEEILDGNSLPGKPEIETLVRKHINPTDDIRGSAGFKNYLAGIMIADCIHSSFNREEK